MKITKSYLQQVIKEELERLGEELTTLDEAFYQGGGGAGEPAYDDLQASTKSQYGNSPKGDRSAAAVAAYKEKNTRKQATMKDRLFGKDPEGTLINDLKQLNSLIGTYGQEANYMKKLGDIFSKIDASAGTIDGHKRPYEALKSGALKNLKPMFDNVVTQKTSGKHSAALAQKKSAKGGGMLGKLKAAQAKQTMGIPQAE